MMGYFWLVAGALVLSANYYLFIHPACRRKKNDLAVEKKFPLGQSFLFEGVYLFHWEVPRFEWYKDGKEPEWSDGLFVELDMAPEQWEQLRSVVGDNLEQGDGFAKVRLTFKGCLTERGHFGHMGFCRYRARVDEIVSMSAIE